MNNFKEYGFEADFEGEIYTSYKSNDNQIFYNGAIWFKPKDDYHYMKPVSWTEKGEVIHHHFQEDYLTNYSLKPIKKEWYLDKDNFEAYKGINMKDNEKEIQELIKNQEGGIFCLNKSDFNKVMNYQVKNISLSPIVDANNSLYFSIGYRLKDNDMKNIKFKEANQSIINKFNKLKDKRKKAEAKLIKANNELKNFALKYEIENYLK